MRLMMQCMVASRDGTFTATDHYCFLPLYVFCGDQLLVSYLRSSKMDGAKHAWAILSLLVKRLRQDWPDVRIIFRGDSGFCRWRMMSWCDRHDVGYISARLKTVALTVYLLIYMNRRKLTSKKVERNSASFAGSAMLLQPGIRSDELSLRLNIRGGAVTHVMW